MRSALGEPIDFEEPLWRYFKTERFLDLLRTGELYFSAAHQFQDPFEGAIAVTPAGVQVDPERGLRENLGDRAFEALRRLTKVSCWHRASYESDAMWQLYAGAWKGVAVRTTAGRVAAASVPFRLRPEYGVEDLWAGEVKYVDLTRNRLRLDMLGRFWHKHLAFSWEREFRLAISLRVAEEFGVPIPVDGIRVSFNLHELIDRIFLGPALEVGEVQEIRDAVEVARLADRVRVSSMLGTPRYA